MCPHDYHHNGFMATPALGTQEVWKYMYMYVYYAPQLMLELSTLAGVLNSYL